MSHRGDEWRRPSVVISGYEEELATAEERLKQAGVPVQRLAVSHGFHSPQMAEMEEEFERVAAGSRFRSAANKTDLERDGQTARRGRNEPPGYWRRQVRQPVRFQRQWNSCAATAVFLEVGRAARWPAWHGRSA